MRDLSSEKSVLIASPPPESLDAHRQGFQVYWNPTMPYALILQWPCDDPVEYCYYPDPARTHLYLLDWDAGTLQFLAARVLVSGFYRP